MSYEELQIRTNNALMNARYYAALASVYLRKQNNADKGVCFLAVLSLVLAVVIEVPTLFVNISIGLAALGSLMVTLSGFASKINEASRLAGSSFSVYDSYRRVLREVERGQLNIYETLFYTRVDELETKEGLLEATLTDLPRNENLLAKIQNEIERSEDDARNP